MLGVNHNPSPVKFDKTHLPVHTNRHRYIESSLTLMFEKKKLLSYWIFTSFQFSQILSVKTH
jgi:hypothetical protein